MAHKVFIFFSTPGTRDVQLIFYPFKKSTNTERLFSLEHIILLGLLVFFFQKKKPFVICYYNLLLHIYIMYYYNGPIVSEAKSCSTDDCARDKTDDLQLRIMATMMIIIKSRPKKTNHSRTRDFSPYTIVYVLWNSSSRSNSLATRWKIVIDIPRPTDRLVQ
jgi:hypothetical protein